MGKYLAYAVLVVALALWAASSAAPASGAGITVGCIGLQSGSWGGPLLWDYAYEVSVIAPPWDTPMDSFKVGTCDLNIRDYSRVMITDAFGVPIPGWIAIYPGDQLCDPEAHWDDKTPHGTVSQGPAGLCLGYVEWNVSVGSPIPVGTTVFCGFDNLNPAHDVGWTAYIDGQMPIHEDWSEEVGYGEGPVHGPIPEPATMGLLVVGGLGILLQRRKN